MIGEDKKMDIRYLKRQGLKNTVIARKLGIDRKTVAAHLDDPKDKIAADERSFILDPYKPYIKARLEAYPDLTAARLHREISMGPEPGTEMATLQPEALFDGSERTTRRYVASLKGARPRRAYKPVETLPGEQAQADFGEFGIHVIDGKPCKIYGFSFVLSYSRIRYVEFTTSQDQVTFLGCLGRALEYIAGVPLRILFDNAKTVVSDRVGSVVQFNQGLLSFATSYSFKADACWLYDPESKGKVESSIKYVKRDFFYGRKVTDLASLNERALAWCDEVANEKQHGTTLEVPAARLADEHRALGLLPHKPVPVFRRESRKVRKDCTFSFETNQYSVPHEYARRQVDLKVFEDKILVCWGDEEIAVHRRCWERGQLILDDDHYEGRNPGERKRRGDLQTRFEAIGPGAPDYLRSLAKHTNNKLSKEAREIVDLAETYGKEAVHAAMVRAMSFGKYSRASLENIVAQSLKNPQGLPQDPRGPRAENPYTGPAIEVAKRPLSDYDLVGEVASE